MRNTVLFLACFLFYSCSHYSPDIEAVLKYAGSNRGELEKVLKQYSSNPADSLKLRAATFLIVNMPGKYSEYYNAPWNDAATVFLRWTSSSDKQLVLNTYKLGEPVIEDDLMHITAKYLINNIELAFKVWQEQPWGKDVPFDVFCEEILPYRLNTEPLENWREKALASFNDLNQSFKDDSTITAVKACAKVNALLPQFRMDKDFPPMSFSQLMATVRGDCDRMTELAAFAMRALGIPVSIDFTPVWPDRNYGHAWNSVYDTTGIQIPFVEQESQPGKMYRPPISKIFRRTFSKQDTLGVEYSTFPQALQDLYRKDATAEYDLSSNLNLPVMKQFSTGAKYAFLCTPFEMQWNPVDWGVVEKDTIRFLAAGKRVLYLPVYYQNNKQSAAAFPFWLDEKGICRFFQPSSNQSITLDRVAPPDEPWVQRMVNGVFEGANKADFSDAKVLYKIKKIDGSWFHTANLKSSSKYRYIRYVSPKSANCNVAEIAFYNKKGEKLRGTVIGTTESWDNSPATRDKAFDGDPTTYFDAANDKSWTGLDLGAPETVAKICYLPRNDGNGIYEGQVYELFYWNGNEWQSLGKKTANSHILQYEAPANALFFLKNSSKNIIYRRPLVIENGKQKWLATD